MTLALTFILLTWQVATEGALVGADMTVRDLAERFSTTGPLSSWVPQLLADLGGPPVVLLVLAFSAGWHRLRGRGWAPEGGAALMLLAVPLLVLPTKIATARPGPDGAALGDYAGYYPSGHAATAALAYGGLAVLRARPAGYTAAVPLNLGTGLGLVLCEYHWLSDVLAGWALSGLVLCGLVVVRERAARGGWFSRPPRCVRRPRAGPSPAPADRSGCRHHPAAPPSGPPR